MKTIRLFGIALLTVLMCVAISSCSKSDDDNNGGGGSSASIVGTWYTTSSIWYRWDKEKNSPNYSDPYQVPDTETLIFTKTEEGYQLRHKYIDPKWDKNKVEESVYDLFINKENDFKAGNNRIVIKSVNGNSMELEWWDGYYSKNGPSEYGIMKLLKY